MQGINIIDQIIMENILGLVHVPGHQYPVDNPVDSRNQGLDPDHHQIIIGINIALAAVVAVAAPTPPTRAAEVIYTIVINIREKSIAAATEMVWHRFMVAMTNINREVKIKIIKKLSCKIQF